MLELKHLFKTYKTKGGETVHALDDVSISFPETGMVFLLGKSGSGKSTLLNVAGGLDRPDSGEIIIKGKNSKDFSGADFDSYRNTFIGFIFQEYNILNEFNVEQNISLALQLQGKPNDKATVDDLLAQVDLAGLGKRKPNTLSGGQKQRVAIARALIKNPEIIMADEPTGALDSTTGKQVFDTLKKLSQSKLVIIVSHDRDFAEIYADRIIELKDGKIISDVTKEVVDVKPVNSNINIVNDHTISIKDASKLSDDDLKEIAKAFKNSSGEAIITSGDHDLGLVRQAVHINPDNSSHIFENTKSVDSKQYDGSQTKFIRSHLPMSRAFKMGASSLKIKPFKMVFTVLLTTVSLTMFGVASTLMLYDSAYSVSQALKQSPNDYELINKVYDYTSTSYQIDNATGESEKQYEYKNSRLTLFGEQEISDINNNNVGHKFAGVFNFGLSNGGYSSGLPLTFSEITPKSDDKYYTNTSLFGLSDVGSSYLNDNNFTINGSYPTSVNEIAISNYTYSVIKNGSATTINSESDVIGKEFKVSLRGSLASKNDVSLKISGIVNVGAIPAEFDDLKNSSSQLSKQDYTKLQSKFSSYMSSSYHCLGFVDKSFYDYYNPLLYSAGNENVVYSDSVSGLLVSTFDVSDANIEENSIYSSFYSDETVKRNSSAFVFYNQNGQKMSYKDISDGQAYASYSVYQGQMRLAYLNYFNKLLLTVNNCEFNSEACSFFNETSTKRQEYRDLYDRLYNSISSGTYPDGYNYATDFEKAKSVIDTYYSNVAKNYYVYSRSQDYISAHNTLNIASTSAYDAFTTSFSKVKLTSPYDLNELANCKAYLISSSDDNLLKHYDAITYADQFKTNEQVQTLINNFNNNHIDLSPSDYEYLVNFIDANASESYDFGFNENYQPSTEMTVPMPKLRYKNYHNNLGSLECVGYFQTSNGGDIVATGNFLRNNGKFANYSYYNVETSNYVAPSDAKYSSAITKTEYTKSQINNLLADHGTYRYVMTNEAYSNLLIYIMLISVLKTTFLIIGIVFGVFAALMLLNYISNSISNKTKEIGILRAVGARGSDLFKIFFSESGVVSAICTFIAIVASAIVCWRLNVTMEEGVGIQLLDFNFINIAIIILGALVIAVLGTFLPVFIASKKQPVDSIRTL